MTRENFVLTRENACFSKTKNVPQQTMATTTNTSTTTITDATSATSATTSVTASPMQIGSIITEVVSNILIGDMYLSVRNAEGQEFTQLFPERMEKIYTHKWKKDNRELGDNEEYKDEAFEITCKVFCKFKFSGTLTHGMNVQVMQSLFYQNYQTSTVHFMPFNVEVLEGVLFNYKFCDSLVEFIENAFPTLPTTYIHNYEGMKLSKDTVVCHKRRREEMLRW